MRYFFFLLLLVPSTVLGLSCTNDYQLVRGNDGKTYHNECLMMTYVDELKTWANVIGVAYQGPCEEEPVCTMQYDPVCGTDGVTYGNACMAQRVGVAYAGVCREEPVIPAGLTAAMKAKIDRAVSRFLHKAYAWDQLYLVDAVVAAIDERLMVLDERMSRVAFLSQEYVLLRWRREMYTYLRYSLLLR